MSRKGPEVGEGILDFEEGCCLGVKYLLCLPLNKPPSCKDHNLTMPKMAKSMALKWYAHLKTGQLKVQFLDVFIF